MTARNWIVATLVISAWLVGAGWLMVANRPVHVVKVEPKFYPLDTDDKYRIDPADCAFVTQDGQVGLLCTDKGEK